MGPLQEREAASMTALFSEQMTMLDQAAPIELRGRVAQVNGLAVHVVDLPVPVGSAVRIMTRHGEGPVLRGEVVSFDQEYSIVMLLGSTMGVKRGDPVVAEQFAQLVRVGESLIGRVIDGMGRPIDDKGPLSDTVTRPLTPTPIDPLDRPLIDTPMATGVRAVDALITVGRGQRMGIFAAPGVGKSTLTGMITRRTEADVTVVALVGERGREVRDFIEHHLGDEGLARSVVVCATSDEPALTRIRSAMVATTIAEYFRDRGLDVLLIMDSVTRFCQAQRQVGLASGEPPTTRGYPPSVFAMLPGLLERSGRTSKGSITGLYTVLVEGDDVTADPISDASRAILDGHIRLSQNLANTGVWPAIDVLESISRVADDVTDAEQQAARRMVIKLVASYRQVEDLLNIGAYNAGSNPDFDLAIAAKPMIDQLMQQGRQETTGVGIEPTRQQLLTLHRQVELIRQKVMKATNKPAAAQPR